MTSDLFYDDGAHRADWAAAGARVVEMEASAVLAVAAQQGARAAVLLGVTDLLAEATRDGQGREGTGGRDRIAGEEYERLGVRLGETAWAALSSRP